MAGRRPFDPGRFGFYYGWIILVAGTIGMLASFPGQTAGVSVFTEHLSDATGLTRLRLATAYLIGTTCSGLLLPFGGRWVDTVGSRVVAFGATCGLAVTLMALSFVGPMSPVTGLIVMSIGFGFLRFCGQGLLTLSSRTMISQWFDRRRGLVSSGSSAAFAFVFSLTPTLLFALVELSDFRWAWRQLSIGLIVILGTIILIFYRNTPEECGLMIDGDTPPPAPDDAAGAVSESDAVAGSGSGSGKPATTGRSDGPSFTRGQAIRDIRFWIVTLPVFSLSVVSTALTFHIVDLGEEVGLDEATIVLIFVPIALISIPITLVAGWLADTISVLRLAVAMAALQLLMYVTVAELAHPVLRIVAVISWGGASGLRSALMAAALPRLFGRAHLGSIAGAQMSALVIGSALGPFLFAWIEAAAGSYQRALVISLIGPVTGLALAGYNVTRQRGASQGGAPIEPVDA